MLNGINFSNWKEQVQFHLGILDLDIALHEFEKPPVPTNTSSAEEKDLYKAWEKSNKLSIMFM
jgi:nucleosome binding factor SPN SPT16 subunit